MESCFLSLIVYSNSMQNQKTILKPGRTKKIITWLMLFMSTCN
jgi:hypothetical protein